MEMWRPNLTWHISRWGEFSLEGGRIVTTQAVHMHVVLSLRCNQTVGIVCSHMQTAPVWSQPLILICTTSNCELSFESAFLIITWSNHRWGHATIYLRLDDREYWSQPAVAFYCCGFCVIWSASHRVFAGAALQASKQDSPSQEEVMQSCAAAQAQQKISKPFLIVPLHQCGCKRYRKRLENVLQTETNKTAARFLAWPQTKSLSRSFGTARERSRS